MGVNDTTYLPRSGANRPESSSTKRTVTNFTHDAKFAVGSGHVETGTGVSHGPKR